MKRPVGVILTAIFAIIGSLLFVLMSVLETFLIVRPPKGAAIPVEANVGLVLGAVMFGALAAWGIATGVGLFRLKNWARISQIVFSSFLALISLISAPVVLIIPAPPNVPAEFSAFMKGIAAAYAVLGLIGIGWIVYFTRPRVKTAFAGADIVRSGRPLSISIIGWWLLVTGFITLPFAFLHSPIILLGWIARGWMATVFMILLALVYVLVGYGLLKLSERARVATIALLLFFAINGVLMAVLPQSQQFFAEQMRSSPFTPVNAAMVPSFPTIIFLFSVPVMLVPLWFLVTRKKAFEHPTTPGVAPTPA